MAPSLRDLELFVAIIDAGSITAGARAVGLSLSSASSRIALLERQEGVELLSRRRGGIVPTAAGTTLAIHARALLERADELRQAMDGLRGFGAIDHGHPGVEQALGDGVFVDAAEAVHHERPLQADDASLERLQKDEAQQPGHRDPQRHLLPHGEIDDLVDRHVGADDDVADDEDRQVSGEIVGAVVALTPERQVSWLGIVPWWAFYAVGLVLLLLLPVLIWRQ